MSILKFTRAPLGEAPFPASAGGGVREMTALALRSASTALGRLAASLAMPSAVFVRPEPQFEFHCEAGAHEGALYLDGMLVGRVVGVRRL